MFKVLFLGDIIGLETVRLLKKNLTKIKEENNIDFVIANANGASDGFGLLPETAYRIKSAGVDIITSGDFVFNKKDIKDALNSTPFLLRPFNLPTKYPGRGIFAAKINDDLSVGVINLLGRINFGKIFAQDQYSAVDIAIEKLKQRCKIIIIDFHGGATSEIQSMYWYVSGKVSAVVGTHLKVLTTDNRVIDGTAVLTGAGFCGGRPSIMGLSADIEVDKIKSGQFIYSKVVRENITLNGAIITIDENTGLSSDIQIFTRQITD